MDSEGMVRRSDNVKEDIERLELNRIIRKQQYAELGVVHKVRGRITHSVVIFPEWYWGCAVLLDQDHAARK